MTVAAKRKKKKNGGVLFLLIFLALICFILFEFVFVIRNVEVTGTSPLPATDIARHAQLNYGSSIFFLKEEEIRRGINDLGEVELVGVTRRLPSTIVIEVRQRMPAAVIVHQNDIVRLDENGYVIGESDGFPAGCVYVTGIHVTACRKGAQISAGQGQLQTMTAVVKAINLAGGAKYVSELDIEDPEDIRITAINKTVVVVGGVGNIEAKMAWFTAAVADLQQRGQRGGTLDVSSGTKADYTPPAPVDDDDSK